MSLLDKNRITEALTRAVEVYVHGEVHQEATDEARRLIRSLTANDLATFTLEVLCDLYETPILDSIESQIEQKVGGKVCLGVNQCEVVRMLSGDQETCPMCGGIADILPVSLHAKELELVCPKCSYRSKI